LSIFLALPRPTFAFYFVLLTPFLSILAATGLQAIGTLRGVSKRPGWILVAVLVVYSIGLGWQVYKMRREIFYSDHDAIKAVATDVTQNTPPDGWVFAFEQVYFEARLLPPPGMENGFNPYSSRDQWLAENRFDTVCMMTNDPRIESLKLFKRYAKNKAINAPNFTMYLFWDRLAGPPSSQ